MSPRGAGAGAIGVLLIAAIGLWAAAVPSESTGTQSVDAARGRTTTTRTITPDDDRPDRDSADTTAPTSADPAPPPTAPKRPSDERLFHEVFTISGDISPKSVVASDDGLFFAQNMMYRHTITVYDRNFELVKTIGDQVRLEEFGLDGRSRPPSHPTAPTPTSPTTPCTGRASPGRAATPARPTPASTTASSTAST
jgi:hypothetical protein